MVTLLNVWKPARESQWKSLGVGVGAEEERGSDNLCCNTAFLPQEVFFFILLPVLPQSASNRDVFWAQEPIVLLLDADWSLRESGWLCTILANCHGDVGRGEAGVGGVLSPQGLRQWHWAHFVQVQSWSAWRRQWSAVMRAFVTSLLLHALSLFMWSSSI